MANTIKKQEEVMLLFVYKKKCSTFAFPKIPLTYL